MKKNMYAVAAAAVLVMMTGCQAKTEQGTTTPSVQETTVAQEINLEDIHEKVVEAYGENYIPSMPYDEQMMEDLFGLKRDLYDSFIAEGPMMSVHVDNFIAIQAKEGKSEEVQQIFDTYRESLVADSMQYPMNQAKVEASEVVRHGDYVFFVMLGTPAPEAEEKGEEAALESARETNQIAIDEINKFFE